MFGVGMQETNLFAGDIRGVDFCAAPAALAGYSTSESFWICSLGKCVVNVNIDSSVFLLQY